MRKELWKKALSTIMLKNRETKATNWQYAENMMKNNDTIKNITRPLSFSAFFNCNFSLIPPIFIGNLAIKN